MKIDLLPINLEESIDDTFEMLVVLCSNWFFASYDDKEKNE